MKGGYIRTKSTIEYWPTVSPVKKATKFDLPGPSTDEQGNVIGDKNIPIAMIDESNRKLSSTLYKSEKLPAADEALKRQGYRIASYEER
jgi:hypothetical protein